MRRLSFLVCLFCAWPSLAAAPPVDVHDRLEIESYIRACEAEWDTVDETGDPTAAAAFLADDYEGVTSKSEVLGRQSILSPFVPDGNLMSNTVDYVHIRFPARGLAIAQGGSTAISKGGIRTSRIWTDVWMLRNKRWQIVTSHDSQLPLPFQMHH